MSRAVPRTVSRKPLAVEADEPIRVRNDESADLPQLDWLHEAIDLRRLIIQPAAHRLDPLIGPYTLPRALVLHGRHLSDESGLLARAGTPRWNPALEPRAGTPRWNPALEPRAGTPRWNPAHRR
jgi:hypothetical protein